VAKFRNSKEKEKVFIMSNVQGMSKRQMLREKRQREQNRSRMIIIGFVALGAILVAWVLVSSVQPPKFTAVDPFVRPNEDFNAAGDPKAPITITEFSDYQCPYCKRFVDDTEKQIIDTLVSTGQVRFVYRSFGLFIGPESQAAAEAAYCAGDQGKFWGFHDYLFGNQTAENAGDFTTRKLQAFAKALDLNMSTFNSCVSSGKYSQTVTQDGIDGQAAGITATPSFLVTYVVNGQKKSALIEGAQPLSAFQTAVQAALTEMGQ
jgi:protein-disulfide isomerase